MGKDVTFKNRDRLIQLGILIATIRRVRNMSQEKLADKAEISRSLLSAIEAPGMAKNFTMDTFLNIAEALSVDPAELLNKSAFSDSLIDGL